MATLDPHIDAIFNGHTHQKYVFDQPVTGGDRPTRPMVQTGQYGENVGQIVLTYDKDTDKVTDAEASNTPRVTTSDADLVRPDVRPELAQVKTTVDAALANAKVDRRPAGRTVSADITTAFKGGAYRREYAGGERDAREAGVDPRRPGRQRAARRDPRRPGQGRHRHREPGWPARRAVLRG